MEEALLEFDVKLKDFVENCIEVDNYRKKVKDKYNALYFLDVAQVIEIIKKFKGKYPNIALEQRGTKPRIQNFNFDTW